MRGWILACVAALASACAPDFDPGRPSPPPSPTDPQHLSLSVQSGIGAAAGTARLTASVQNAFGDPLAGTAVTFSAKAGQLSATVVTADKDGRASTTLTASPGAVEVSARVGPLEQTTLAAIQAPPATPQTPPATPPPPGPDFGALTISLPAIGGTVGSSTVINANVGGVPQNPRYTWTYGDGSSGQTFSSSTAHTYATIGSYTISVRVSDDTNRGASANGTVTISAAPPPPPPPPALPGIVVTLTAAPTAVTTGGSSTLTAATTPFNGAGAVTSYAWDCDGNGTPEVTNASNTHLCSYPTAGTITSRVTVSDGTVQGAGSTTVTVTTPPTPVVTVSCSNATLPAASNCVVSATLNGVAVPSSSITITAWDWGEGNTGANGTGAGFVSQSHTYAAPSTYHVIVTATVPGGGAPGTGQGTTIVS